MLDVVTVLVGMDLAWGYRARTGLAALDDHGRLLDVASVITDEEILGWVDQHQPQVVAIDAPLVVATELGQRPCEREVARAYSRFGAACHTSNATRMPSPRAAVLACGRWAIDARPGAQGPRCAEVYPHAALVGLFELPYRLLYKKGPFPLRHKGFLQLLDLLEGWSVLDLHGSTWEGVRRRVEASVRPVDLDRVEDEVDAVICAGLALLLHRGEQLDVYGDPHGEHVVAPPPPMHRAIRPLAP